ncbi:deoxycytidylate deaminase [environmental Halophage eHP-30]|nr:deoxycytidylate deaminase [environmental Halophage eHP-30]
MHKERINQFHRVHLLNAYNYASLSRCQRLKVGAVIVKDSREIAYGYNGTPPGWCNICEEAKPDLNGELIKSTKQEVIHAEMNALAKCAASEASSYNAIMYCTHCPCSSCAFALMSAGIREVHFCEHYRKHDGLHALQQHEIEVFQHQGL